MKKIIYGNKICLECGEEFSFKESSKVERKKRFCSRKCSSSNNGKRNKGRKCSEEHKEKLSIKMKGENNPFFGKDHKEETKIKWSEERKGVSWEEKFGKEKSQEMKQNHRDLFSGEKNPFFGRKHTNETKAKISENHRGKENWVREKISKSVKGLFVKEKNPAWKGGISFGEYGIEFDNDLKSNIRKRDKFVCAVCNKNGFVIHHIDYDKKNNEVMNLITLCRSCHGKTGFNRQEWRLFFAQILEKRRK